MIIAVDGPAAAGKGTIARALAAHFGFHFLDTGSLYRMVGRRVLDQGLDPMDTAAAVLAARSLDPRRWNDDELRGEEIGQAASVVAAMPAVRAELLDFQRAFAHTPPGSVLDGRDIGTIVCPDAEVKIFVTATPAIRALRRARELAERGRQVDDADVLAEIHARDERDRSRPFAPMIPAEDAYVLDTSDMEIEEAVATAVAIVNTAITGRRAISGS